MNLIRRLIEGYRRMYMDSLWRQRNACEQDVRRLGGKVTWE